jgi:hypothetical protein
LHKSIQLLFLNKRISTKIFFKPEDLPRTMPCIYNKLRCCSMRNCYMFTLGGVFIDLPPQFAWCVSRNPHYFRLREKFIFASSPTLGGRKSTSRAFSISQNSIFFPPLARAAKTHTLSLSLWRPNLKQIEDLSPARTRQRGGPIIFLAGRRSWLSQLLFRMRWQMETFICVGR